MNSMVDDELGIGSDDELGDYDITNEREEALLEGDDEEFHEAKKPQYESDGSDVLELDYEEDFQDEESEKSVEKPERAEDSNSKEQNLANKGKSVQKPNPVNVPRQNRPNSVNTGNKNQPPRVQNYRRANNGNQKWQKGHRKGYFQPKQNAMKDRRNATVLINPRFEGPVHIKENNARLSWDSLKYSQPPTQNPIQPWRSGNLNGPNPQNQLIVSNLVTGLASLVQPNPLLLPPPQRPTQNFSHPPSQNFAQSTPQNFYNHPPPESAEHRLCFEPPPHLNTSMAPPPPSYSSLSMPLKPSLAPPQRRNYQDYSAPSYAPSQGYWKTGMGQRMTYEDRNPQYDTPNYDERKPFYSNNSGYDFKTNYERNDSFQYDYRNDYEYKNNFKSVESKRTTDFNHRNFNFKSTYTQSKSPYNYNKEPARNDRFVGRKPVLTTIESKDEIPEKRLKAEVVPQVKEPQKPVMIATEDASKKNSTEIKQEKQEVEEEDEEMRIYRQKIEEQKRERERILKIKEERRKQRLELKKQQDDAKLITAESKKNQPNVASKFAETNSLSVQQQPGPGPQVSNKPKPLFTKPSVAKAVPPQRPNVVQPPVNSSEFDEMSNFTFKVANDFTPKTESTPTASSFMSNRVVTVKTKTCNASNPAPPVNPDPAVDAAVSSFFNNRKVLKKDNNFINTKLVVVSNLSANFGENKLMELSKGIGEIQTLRLDKQERQATILFKSVASAHAFFKKYQRRILDDLSVIEVKLEPMI